MRRSRTSRRRSNSADHRELNNARGSERCTGRFGHYQINPRRNDSRRRSTTCIRTCGRPGRSLPIDRRGRRRRIRGRSHRRIFDRRRPLLRDHHVHHVARHPDPAMQPGGARLRFPRTAVRLDRAPPHRLRVGSAAEEGVGRVVVRSGGGGRRCRGGHVEAVASRVGEAGLTFGAGGASSSSAPRRSAGAGVGPALAAELEILRIVEPLLHPEDVASGVGEAALPVGAGDTAPPVGPPPPAP